MDESLHNSCSESELFNPSQNFSGRSSTNHYTHSNTNWSQGDELKRIRVARIYLQICKASNIVSTALCDLTLTKIDRCILHISTPRMRIYTIHTQQQQFYRSIITALFLGFSFFVWHEMIILSLDWIGLDWLNWFGNWYYPISFHLLYRVHRHVFSHLLLLYFINLNIIIHSQSLQTSFRFFYSFLQNSLIFT